MARGQVRIRLDGLKKARTRIKALNGRATDRSISKNILRIAGAYNVRIVPVDTTRLLRSFRAQITRNLVRLKWGGIKIDGELVDYARIANERGSSRGYAEKIARETAADIGKYAQTGKKPRTRAVRRFGRNTQGLNVR